MWAGLPNGGHTCSHVAKPYEYVKEIVIRSSSCRQELPGQGGRTPARIKVAGALGQAGTGVVRARKKVRGRDPGQQSLLLLYQSPFLENLKTNDKRARIFPLLAVGWSYRQIAGHLGVYHSWVGRIVQEAEALGLVKRGREGMWALSPLLKSRVRRAGGEQTYCRPHNFGMKFDCVASSLTRDTRAGFVGLVRMTGGERWKFEMPGEGHTPAVLILHHPGTIQAWVRKGEIVEGRNIPETRAAAEAGIHTQVAIWAARQNTYGGKVEVAAKGRLFTKPEFGFKAPAEGMLRAVVGMAVGPEGHVDGSPAELGDHEHLEWETTSQPVAEVVEQTLHAMANPAVVAALKTMPEVMKKMDEIQKGVDAVHLVANGGPPLQREVSALTFIVAELMAELKGLKRGKGTRRATRGRGGAPA